MIDYRSLDVYHEARALTKEIYFRATLPLPPYLRWRLGSQLDDAADSIGSNLAQGCGRKNPLDGNVELIRYGRMAFASACEVEHRLASLHDRQLISDEVFHDLNTRVRRVKGMLLSLIRSWSHNDRGRRR